TLGELGSWLELTVHNVLQLRWSAMPWDPATRRPHPSAGREETSERIDEGWDRPEYDYLGDTYSAHVNPVFWKLHLWIDDPINDWSEAHHGAVEPREIGGIPWFAVGPLVGVAQPWVGAFSVAQPQDGEKDVQTGSGDADKTRPPYLEALLEDMEKV